MNTQQFFKTEKQAMDNYDKRQRKYSDEVVAEMRADPKRVMNGYEHLMKE